MKPPITVFLSGDVMTGRGIDQALPFPGDPRLYEPSMKSAVGYVELAERVSGGIPRPVQFDYIWGDALEELRREQPQARIINLETAVTHSLTPWEDKEIHYRMSPENIPCLTAAGIDCCVLANNHTMDWGPSGLLETLDTLDRTGIRHAGAGRNLREARAPAILAAEAGSRLLVFALGSLSSGIPSEWSAGEDRPGLNILEEYAGDAVRSLAREIGGIRREGDVVVVSIHWGANWGYGIPLAQQKLARRLIDEAEVAVIHGHSSHHVKAIEVYRERLILYGCGDLLNDYEGIQGYEAFRGDLGLMYFADLEPFSGRLVGLRLVPMQMRRFRLTRASAADTEWLGEILNREGKRFHTRVSQSGAGSLRLHWA
ncbi:MAG TPA: CapA family protein [candidate division Zixibacteria bacterium]|nr:CapA family protein [candidate division Zixibacteria bacterium]